MNLFAFLQKFLGQSLGGVKLQCCMQWYGILCISLLCFKQFLVSHLDLEGLNCSITCSSLESYKPLKL